MNEYSASSWLAQAAAGSEQIEIAGHRRLSLEDPARVWWVETGSVELFSNRTNLGTLPRGSFLFGISERPRNRQSDLFVTGKAGTCLRQLSEEQFVTWSVDPDRENDLVTAMLPWVHILLHWARQADVGTGAARELPVTEDGTKLTDTAVSLLASLLLQGKLTFFLDRLAGDALRAAAQFRDKEDQAALGQQKIRMRERAKAELEAEKVLRDAGHLISTIGPPLGPEATDLLFQTLKLVADATGIELREPPAASGRNFHEEAALIVEHSRVRLRKVALRGFWWKEDHGPLLAQRTDGVPLALLPLPRGQGYECIDRAAATRQRLTGAQAEDLSVFAFMLYRPLPVEPVLHLRHLLGFAFAGLQRDAAQLLAAGAGIGLLGSAIPLLTGWLIDQAVIAADRSLLTQCVLGLFVVSLAAPLLKVFENYTALRLEGRTDLALQAALWDRLLNLPARFFRQIQAGDLADRMTGILRIRALVAKSGRVAILGTVSSLFYLGLMLYYSPKLAWIGLLITVTLMTVSLILARGQLRWQRQMAEHEGNVSATLFQLLSGVSKIRIAGAESHAFLVWSTAFAQQLRATVRAGRWQNGSMIFQAIFPVLAPLALFVAAAPAEDGVLRELSTGQFVAFFSAFGLLSAALLSVCEVAPRLAEAAPIYQRLRPILEGAPEVEPHKQSPGPLEGEIRLSRVSFRYDPDGGPWILRDIELDIRPGEFVALVGPSGSGKSSLLRLLLGFEKPETGTITYDGQDLAMLDLRAVRRQIGVVLQTSKPFAADILQNIVGTSSRSLEEALAAARQAGFDQDIDAMPMRWHTFVGEEGGNLSGGQRQRLMIARALIHQPRIVLMDEATSALDNRTQRIVSESLDQLHVTRVVVAHRLSTIRNADKIVVLVDGRIVEQGTFEQLMEQDGEFAKLARRQLVETPEEDARQPDLLPQDEVEEGQSRLDQIQAAGGFQVPGGPPVA